MKIGDKVKISDCNYYDAEGEIIGETKMFFRVKISNHETMGVPWDNQEHIFKLFHKKKEERGEHLERGFSKEINTGDFLGMYNKKVV